MNDHLRKHGLLIACAALIVLVFAAFWPVLGGRFVNYDDDGHVTGNPEVQAGLVWDSIVWAFTTTETGIWHPIVWLSHMTDCQISGTDASGHHMTSLIFHALSALLLFLVLRRLTGSLWRGFFVAALFAVHPLHVESVAWISERKDVLSAFFLFLTILAYVRYTECPGIARYVLVATFFILGLMSKPMLVTLPVLLLLLDYWPLNRLSLKPSAVSSRPFAGTNTQHPTPSIGGSTSKSNSESKNSSRRLLIEKMPLFALAAGFSVVAYYAQQTAGTVGSITEYPLGVRLANALAAYVGYILKMLWPGNLAVFYPHPGGSLPAWQVAASGLVLICISLLIARPGRKCRYLAVGWLWYVVTLLPVIGLIQVGDQAMADRYTYIPLIGLFLMMAWGIPDLLRIPETRNPRPETRERTPNTRHLTPTPALPLGIVALIILGALTWRQAGYWHDSETLFRHALSVTKGNYLAHHNLGVALRDQGDLEGSMAELRQATRIRPDYGMAFYNLGTNYEHMQKPEDAAREYRRAIEADPMQAAAYHNLGIILKDQGKYDEAIRQYRKAIDLRPDMGTAYYNMSVALYCKGEYAAAWKQVHAAERLGVDPPPSFLDALSQMEPEPTE